MHTIILYIFTWLFISLVGIGMHFGVIAIRYCADLIILIMHTSNYISHRLQYYKKPKYLEIKKVIDRRKYNSAALRDAK